MTSRAVPAGTLVPGRSNHVGLLEGWRPEKEQLLALQVGGWSVGHLNGKGFLHLSKKYTEIQHLW